MARYFLRYRHSDTGLTPTFNFFKKASDLSVVTPPAVGELGSGTYYFDYSPTFDIVFEVDGGASIPTEEVRFIADTISPKDVYVDEPISQVRTDVWTDSTSYTSGQKGKRVDQLGDPTDASSATTMFGKELLYKESIRGDSAGTSDGDSIKVARDRVMGGTGFGGTGVDVKTVKDTIGTPADASSASTVFGKTLLYKESVRGDSAGTGDGENVKLARDRVMGGTGYGGTGVDVKTVNDNLATAEGNVLAIKSKTDNLPSDPASQATTNTSVSNAVTSIKGGSNIDNTQIKTDTAAIKAKTDNLPSDPASQATTLSEVNAARDVITGSPAISLRTMAGSGFSGATDSLQNLAVGIGGGLTAGQVAAAVWDALLATHSSPNTFGAYVATVALTSDVTTAVTSIKGVAGPTLLDIAGSGFSTGTHSLKLSSDALKRALGMLHENSVLDQTTFTVDNNLLTGRMRIYDSKANADAAWAASPGIYDTGKVAEYAVLATYTGTNLKTYKVSREA
jgi:hypothetical protein